MKKRTLYQLRRLLGPGRHEAINNYHTKAEANRDKRAFEKHYPGRYSIAKVTFNPSFRKTKKAARKLGARIPSSRRAKRALKYPAETTVSRALANVLGAALGKRKSARARLTRRGRTLRLEVSR
jgi:hypothetical protein